MTPPDGVAGEIAGAVHSRIRHDSARGHVTGTAQYIDDLPLLPGTLEVAFVTSPHAHARIVAIDTAKARAMSGVHAVLTAADIPGRIDVGPIFEGEPILADGVVEHVGHPVAVVAAES
jgi:xanthine dehydrogenase large subunit